MKGLLGFTLAGLLGGALVGLLDLGQGGGLAVGVDALLGAMAGALAGLLFPLVPPRLRALSLLRHLASRLRPGDHDALHDRCRTVTMVWLLAVGLPAFLMALEVVEPWLLGRMRSRLLAALAVSLVGLALSGLALALVAPVQAGLARALETLVRRRPALSPSTRPEAHALAALVVGALLLSRSADSLASVPLAAAALLVATTLVGGELALRLPGLALAGLLVAALGAAGFVARPVLGGPAARAALSETPALGALIRAARPPSESPAEAGP